MLNASKGFSVAVAVVLLIAAVSGCQKQAGPAEQAGKAVDQAVEKAGQQLEKAGDSLQDTAKGNNTK
jgi:hypothetical protein